VHDMLKQEQASTRSIISVWYSALYGYSAIYLLACYCLSGLVLNILRVVAATVPSESEFQSWTFVWLNMFLWTSRLLWRTSNLFLCPMVHRPSALRKNISGSRRSNMILNTWILPMNQVFLLFTCFGHPLKVINHLGHENQTGSLA